MQTKTYFASSVPAALEVARQELGDNALLVGSKPTPPQARQYGRLEVTFAWDPDQMPKQLTDAYPQGRTATSAFAAASPPVSDMEEIRQQLSALRMAVGRSGHLPGTHSQGAPSTQNAREDGVNTQRLEMAERLEAAGFTRETATDLAAGASSRSRNPDTAVLEEITSRIAVSPFLEMKPGESRTLAFVGPAGRGKTTSLVKIALGYGLARRVPVRIFCAGAHAVGAQEQMARFAAILGTPYQACESLASLNLALNGEGWKGLALIDTPGISPADRNELEELKQFFTGRPEIEKHLVLRADASSADMLHMMSRFSGLAPSRLLFTGTDEATRMAPLAELLIRSGIPTTFAGTGQQIPDDLEELNADTLARAVWAGSAAVAATANQARFAQAAA